MKGRKSARGSGRKEFKFLYAEKLLRADVSLIKTSIAGS
jgi:hypothetical protein